jgi:signal transduction histidine kinase
MTIALVGMAGYRAIYPYAMWEMANHYTDHGVEFMSAIDKVMYDHYKLVTSFATNPVISKRASSAELVTSELLRHKKLNPSISSISFFNMERIRLADTEGVRLGEKHDMTLYWERALRGELTIGEDVRVAEELHIPIIYFVSPVRDKRGEQFGVVVVRYSAANLLTLMERLAIEPKVSFVTLVDRDRRIIFTTDPSNKNNTLKYWSVPFTALELAIKGNTGTIVERNPMDGKDYMMVYTAQKGILDLKGNGWSLILAVDYDLITAQFVEMRHDIINIAIVIAIIAALLVYLATKVIVRPIEDLRKGVEIVESGRLDYIIEERGGDEIARLTRSFNVMVHSLDERSRRLNDTIAELESFSYSVSHDLRTPLRGIDGFSQVLMEEYDDVLDEQGKRHLTRIRAASQRMGKLITDMLILSRVSRGEMTRENVDLSVLAMEIKDRLIAAEPTRDIEIKIEDGLFVNNADPNLLERVMENLIGNAWKFTCSVESAKIEIGSEIINKERVFYVRDNGAGFDMAYVDKLFGPFQRLHLVSEFEGTGVGLAIVERVIKRHNGRVWGEGEVGKGATFYFTL